MFKIGPNESLAASQPGNLNMLACAVECLQRFSADRTVISAVARVFCLFT